MVRNKHSHTNTAFALNSPCFNGTKHLISIYGNWDQFKQISYIANNHFNHVPTVRSFEKILLSFCFTYMFKNCPKSNITSSSIPTDQRWSSTATTPSLPPFPRAPQQPTSQPERVTAVRILPQEPATMIRAFQGAQCELQSPNRCWQMAGDEQWPQNSISRTEKWQYH